MRIKQKSEKGITLIALTITIIVILILAGAATYTGIGTIQSTRFTAFTVEMKILQTGINTLSQDYADSDVDVGEALTDEQKNIFNVTEVSEILNNRGNNDTAKVASIKEGMRYFTSESIKNDLKIDGVSDDYYINIKERVLICTEPFDYEGKSYYMLEQIQDGLYNVTYENQTEGEIEDFDINLTTISPNKWRIEITNIKYKDPNKNYVNDSTLQVKYQIEGNPFSNSTIGDLNFYVTQPGKYKIQLLHGEEVTSGTKEILIRSSEGNWDGEVNSPSLSAGMIPIKYVDGNWVITDENDPDWYQYGTTADTRNWANIMLSDGKYYAESAQGIDTTNKTKARKGITVAEEDLGSMFVWIPRYAYNFPQYHVAKSNGEGTTQNITNVVFLKETSNQDKSGNRYERDYDISTVQAGQATPTIVHPAFKLGDQEVTGIWVAKFEASMAENNTNTGEDNNVTNKTVKVLPNKESWRHIVIGNMFTNCLNMNKEKNVYGINKGADTHLMKNNEWGAVAYLAASQYGIVPTANSISETYQENGKTNSHLYTGGKDYKTNVSQSTTGNITGIYDLNGGAWDVVASYYNNGDSNLSEGGTTEYFPDNQLNTKYEKYWDKYLVDEEEIRQMELGIWEQDNTQNPMRKQITARRYDLFKTIKGDAMYEVINTYSYWGKLNNQGQTYSWMIDESANTTQYGNSYYNGDYIAIGSVKNVFMARGGRAGPNIDPGIFASAGAILAKDHIEQYYWGFRPTFTVK